MVVTDCNILEHRSIGNHFKVAGKVRVVGQKISNLVWIAFQSMENQLTPSRTGTDRNLVQWHFLEGSPLGNGGDPLTISDQG